MAKRKQITITFQATDKDFNNQMENIKTIFKTHELMTFEYGNLDIDSVKIKIERVSGGFM